jgi:hypothetical protein
VYVTGIGWEPGKDVQLVFQEVFQVHSDEWVTVILDELGNITDSGFGIQLHYIGMRFFIIAIALDSPRRVQAIHGFESVCGVSSATGRQSRTEAG